MNSEPILNDIRNLILHNVAEPDNIWLIITLRNAEKWVESCLQSIFMQSCVNKVKLAICDDNSTDNSPIIIDKYKSKYPEQVFFIKNTERKYKLRNAINLLNSCPINDNDVVAFLDGDDWLSDANSLQIVLNKYSSTGCWITYGNYKRADGSYDSCCREMTAEEKKNNNFRGMQWIFSHLFTFRYFLWKSVPSSYFQFDNDCQYKFAPDMIINLALLDIAKSSRIQFISERIHIYNNISELNECKIDPYAQEQSDILTRRKILKGSIIPLYDYSIIIPYMKRRKHLEITYLSIKESLKYTDKKVNIIVVEHDTSPSIKEYCNINRIEYIYIPLNNRFQLSLFNRSLSFDVAVLFGLPSKGYVLHDVDIYIPTNFWKNIDENLLKQNVEALQTYANRVVYRIDKNTTEKLHSNEISYKDITTTHCLSPHPGSWGGSIYISRNLYFKIGGSDPDLFVGYAPEDQMFVYKIMLISNIGFANDPPIELYHQWHEPTDGTNPYLNNMIQLYNYFKDNKDAGKNYMESKGKFMSNI